VAHPAAERASTALPTPRSSPQPGFESFSSGGAIEEFLFGFMCAFRKSIEKGPLPKEAFPNVFKGGAHVGM
jgi:hypothetical protein